MNKTISIALPIFKRLNYVQHILGIIDSQDYSNIELIVSDNGENRIGLQRLVETSYKRPFRFRRNAESVSVGVHLNQILAEAQGEYFMLLADDDEITPNYVSEMVRQLDAHPEASAAVSRQEIIDMNGTVIRGGETNLPEILSGTEFVRSAWIRYNLGIECFSTVVVKTELAKMRGGYPDFSHGNYIDNSFLLRVALDNWVVFSERCTFRWRVHEASHGWSAGLSELADASMQFIELLSNDESFKEFSITHPEEWKKVKSALIQMARTTYLWRWRELYRRDTAVIPWLKAGFALPYNKEYYLEVLRSIRRLAEQYVKTWLRGASVDRRAALFYGETGQPKRDG